MAYDFQVSSGLAYIKDLTVQTLRGVSDSITNAMVSSSAAIASSKLLNRIQLVYSQEDGSTVAATSGDGYPIYVCDKTNGATVKKVTAFCMDAPSGGGTEEITIDVKYADDDPTAATSILSSTISISDSQADYEPVNGTISTSDLSQGDTLMVTVAVAGSGGTQGQGLVVQVEVEEAGS